MKIFNRIACLAAAAVMSVCAVMPAYADAEEERVIDPYTENEEMLTEDTDAPTISFDLSDWSKYLTVTDEGSSLISMKLDNDNKTAYQGQSLKVSVASDSDVEGLHQYSWEARDADGNYIYPETQGDGADDLDYITTGFVLKASDFGLNYFDGGMLTFKYRINPDADGLLMDNSCFVFPCYGDDYNRVESRQLKLEYNNTDSNNTTMFANGVMSVSDGVGADKIVFTVPLVKKTDKIDVLYLDNIVFTTQSGKQVINLDGYNENAKEQKGDLAIEVQKKDNTISIADSGKSKTEGTNVVIIVGAVILGLAVVAGIVFLVIKLKNRFY